LQATHVPSFELLQTCPPLWSHVLPERAGCDGTPDEQMSLVHWLSSTGVSASLATLVMPPVPLHTRDWQSPVVCAATGVPVTAYVIAQTLLLHVRD